MSKKPFSVSISIQPDEISSQSSQRLEKIKNAIANADAKRDVSNPYNFVSGINLENLKSSLPGSLVGSGVVKKVLLVGIGGSSLGAKAIYSSLSGKVNNESLFVLDNLSHLLLKDAVEFINMCETVDEFVIILSSKSGTTWETRTNYKRLTGALADKFDVNKRTLILTQEGSSLEILGKKKNIPVFNLSSSISGRFSALSYQAMIPLTLAGVSVGKLLSGANKCLNEYLSDDLSMIERQALSINEIYNDGRYESINLVFSEELITLNQWLSQLLSESLGKNGEGILPVTGLATRDFHSLTQYIFGGRKKHFLQFIYENEDGDAIKESIYKGFLEALDEEGIPYMAHNFSKVSAYNVGYFLMSKMIETVILAELFGVEPFTQNQVERYKELSRLRVEKS